MDYWGEGGGGRVCWPPSQIIGGPGPLGPHFLRLWGGGRMEGGGGWKGDGWRGRLQYSREDRGGGVATLHVRDNLGIIFLIDGTQVNLVEKYTYL